MKQTKELPAWTIQHQNKIIAAMTGEPDINHTEKTIHVKSNVFRSGLPIDKALKALVDFWKNKEIIRLIITTDNTAIKTNCSIRSMEVTGGFEKALPSITFEYFALEIVSLPELMDGGL